MTQNYGIENINFLKTIPEEHTIPVILSSEESGTTELESFVVNITFNEPVYGFVVGDIVVLNGTKSNFLGSGKTYSVEITPIDLGEVTIDIPAGAAHNRIGYVNSPAFQFSIESVSG